MFDIEAQVDLAHPVHRVWRALTDPGLLARWFTEVDVLTGGRLLLHTVGLPGFHATVDARVTELRTPELVALRCDEGDRCTRLTCTITPTAEGCRLSVGEVFDDGAWPAADRLHRQESYHQALTGRLPAILDWLAFQEVDLRRDDADATVVLPAVPGASSTRRRRPALVAALAGGALLAGLGGWALWPAEPNPTAAPAPAAGSPSADAGTGASATVTATTTGPGRSPRPSPSSATPTPEQSSPAPSPSTASPSSSSTPGGPTSPAEIPPVTGRYVSVSTGLLGYTGQVVVENPAGVAQDWTVVIRLAPGSSLNSVSGADYQQQGRTITFTGPAVPAGGSLSFRFTVADAAPRKKAPESCTVGDDPCAGL